MNESNYLSPVTHSWGIIGFRFKIMKNAGSPAGMAGAAVMCTLSRRFMEDDSVGFKLKCGLTLKEALCTDTRS